MHQIGLNFARAARIWCKNAPDRLNSRASCPNLVQKCTRLAQLPRELPESGAEMHQIGLTPARAARIWCGNAPDRLNPRANARIWCGNAPDRLNPRANARIWCRNAPDQPKLRASARIWCRNAPDWPNSRASCPNLVQKCTRLAQLPRELPESGAKMHQIGQTSRERSNLVQKCTRLAQLPRELPESGAEMHQIGLTPARAARIWCGNAPDRLNPRANARIWCKNAPDQPKLRANLVQKCTRLAKLRVRCPNLVQKCTRSAQLPRERPIMPLTARPGRRRAPFSRTETAGTGRSRSSCPTRCTAASGCRSARW